MIISGRIVNVDPAGLLITDITVEQLRGAPRDHRTTVRCEEHETSGLFPLRHGQPRATLVARLGGDGRLQLEVVGCNAAELLGVGVGARVTVSW